MVIISISFSKSPHKLQRFPGFIIAFLKKKVRFFFTSKDFIKISLFLFDLKISVFRSHYALFHFSKQFEWTNSLRRDHSKCVCWILSESDINLWVLNPYNAEIFSLKLSKQKFKGQRRKDFSTHLSFLQLPIL